MTGQMADERVQVARPLLVRAVEHVRAIEDDGRDAVANIAVHRLELHG
jgi:hypothetical protein